MCGALAAAVATPDTGGARSPARFLQMLVLIFTAYFFRPARRGPIWASCTERLLADVDAAPAQAKRAGKDRALSADQYVTALR